MSFGFFANAQEPVLPIEVLTRFALDSLASTRLTKLGLVFMLAASWLEVLSSAAP